MVEKFLRVVTLEDARAELERHWKPMPLTDVASIGEALGSVLAEDVVSPVDVPPFDRALYDGFAVRASDTFGAGEETPKKLGLAGKLLAGKFSRKSLDKGKCFEIATGAPIPHGSDAVVMSEDARTNGGSVSVQRAVAPGENVAERGSDVRKGRVVAGRGKTLNVRNIGAIAAVGVETVIVHSGPKVAVISTGSELVEPGKKLPPAKIYDANGYVLSQAVKSCGAEAVRMGIAADDSHAILKIVKKALKNCDVVLVSGGTSAGRGDLVPEVVGRLGKVLIHGLALKPGKPTFIAVAGGKPVFGLPGYPVSALMNFDQLVAPYLRRMAGVEKTGGVTVRAKLSRKIVSARGRRELVPVKLNRRGKEDFADPLLKGSGAIVSLSAADGYIEIPREQELVEEGERVRVMLFG